MQREWIPRAVEKSKSNLKTPRVQQAGRHDQRWTSIGRPGLFSWAFPVRSFRVGTVASRCVVVVVVVVRSRTNKMIVFFKNLQFNLQCGGVTFNAAMEYEWTFAASGRVRRVFSRRGRESTPERRRRRRGRGRRAVGCDGRDGRLWRGRRDRA